MKRILTITIRLSCFLLFANLFSIKAKEFDTETASQRKFFNCTSIMAGRLATTDGSVITSHTCDGIYRTWVEIFQETL